MASTKPAKSTKKTDQMRALREEQHLARLRAARDGASVAPRAIEAEPSVDPDEVKRAPPEKAVDVRINETTETDPNGRGGRVRVNVPKPPKDGGLPKTKAQRDNFPVPGAKKVAAEKARPAAEPTQKRVRVEKRTP